MELDENGIALGDTTEDKKARKKFIREFYKVWGTLNPTKQIFNKSLSEYINVKHISVEETSGQASVKYKSTLAVFFLSEILEKGTIKGNLRNANTKKDNQKRSEKIIIMEYDKPEFGKIKLIVGVKRGTKEKIQYCVSVIENG